MATKKNVRVQGSRFWAYEPETQTLIRLSCLTTFDPGSDSAGKIEDTCLDEEDLKMVCLMPVKVHLVLTLT